MYYLKDSWRRKDARLSGESVQGRFRCCPSQREFSTVKGKVVVGELAYRNENAYSCGFEG